MLKTFQLSKLINQENNFAIYEDFFDECKCPIFVYTYLIDLIE